VFFWPSKGPPAFPGVPSCSFLFPRGVCRDCWEVGRRAQGMAFPQVIPEGAGPWHWSG
jgi:hypothetical protein